MRSAASRYKLKFLILSFTFVLLSAAAFSVGTISLSANSEIRAKLSGSFDLAAADCSYTISPDSQTFRGAGGTGVITVTTNPGCTWTAQSLANWITITSGTSGNGSGTVEFSVSATPFSERTGRISVAGNLFTVIQTAECSYSLSSGSLTVSNSGGSGSFSVTSSSPNCVGTVRSNDSWITITSDSLIIGEGTVSFTVQPNTGAARTGTITVGDRTFIITQATGCTYSISAANASLSASAANLTVNVITGTGCTWTALSSAAWITVTSPTNSSGAGTVTLAVAANTGPTRIGTVTIAGQIFTVTQGSGCAYMISPTSANVSAAGESGSLSVTTGAGCFLLTRSNADWIVIDSTPLTGPGTISYTVRPNFGPARTGTIIVGGQTYTITQALGCAYALSPASINVPSGSGAGTVNLNTAAGCAWTAVSNVPWLTVTSPAAGSGSAVISFNVGRNTDARRTGTLTIGGQTFTVVQTAGNTVRFDFDGDGKADISVFRPEMGIWYLLNSATGFTGVGFGISTDTIVPADYDGDGKTDIAVYRGGTWFLLRSAEGFAEIEFGSPTDIPHPADLDGDGRAELVYFRPSNGVWYIRSLTTDEETTFAFGQAGDIPVAADYDGDGITDIAVYRGGVWFIQASQAGFTVVSFGIASDKPVPADYDGDGRADIAVFRPDDGVWYIQRSRDGFFAASFGLGRDEPVPADYDGDGKTDIAVYRGGTWFFDRSTTGFAAVAFGNSADQPVPNAYVP